MVITYQVYRRLKPVVCGLEAMHGCSERKGGTYTKYTVCPARLVVLFWLVYLSAVRFILHLANALALAPPMSKSMPWKIFFCSAVDVVLQRVHYNLHDCAWPGEKRGIFVVVQRAEDSGSVFLVFVI